MHPAAFRLNAGSEPFKKAMPMTVPVPFSMSPIQPRTFVGLVRISQVFLRSAMSPTHGWSITRPRVTFRAVLFLDLRLSTWPSWDGNLRVRNPDP
jgi:hypothetical protein